MTSHTVDTILFGAAYYDEYMPRDLDRIDTDMDMMTAAGINVIRIAESTWSTCEPQPGVFDWTHVDRAIEAAERHGLKVIVGTPTYAVPTWLVRMHPDVLAETPAGSPHYGARQIVDIVNPAYRFYGERVIRGLVSRTADRPCVIGFQVDNETKYYDSVSRDMQALFVKRLRDEFKDDLEALNAAFGLDYWSNRINSWEDFPDMIGSINQSLRGEFDRFRRRMVTEYLAWQADIVREYAREDQFVTQNFDYEWRGYSYGVQPAVDHFKAVRAMDIAGVDIYHPTEDFLTGKEIAFGGDMSRSLKDGRNYLVLETQAQGQHGWLPYPGQLRLQAYSHLASGADAVMYWHWHSIHNSFETYWKGLLSHDLEPNPVYEEAGVFGREIARDDIGPRLRHLTKRNQVAIMVSNEALSALDWFTIDSGFPGPSATRYNDVVRAIHDALFELNIEADFIPPDASAQKLSGYRMVITPALYVADQATIDRLSEYVGSGGYLVSTVRSFVANEYTTVWHDRAPHSLTDVFGMYYQFFTRPNAVPLAFDADGALGRAGFGLAGAQGGESRPRESRLQAQALIELLDVSNPAISADTEVLARYDHYAWKRYAAITRHAFGSGDAEWIGTILDADTLRAVIREAADNAGVTGVGRSLAGAITVREGINALGEHVTYLLNYSAEPVAVAAPATGDLLLTREAAAGTGTGTGVEDGGEKDRPGAVSLGDEVTIAPWGVQVIVGE